MPINNHTTKDRNVFTAIEGIQQKLYDHYDDSDFVKAKTLFFKDLGMAHEEQEDYDSRMLFFLDWCCFFYTRNMYELSLFEQLKLTNKDYEKIRVHYSTYQILKVSKLKVLVYDYLAKKKILVTPLEDLQQLYQVGQFLQSFIYSKDSNSYINKGIIFHPLAATDSLKKKLVKIKKNDDYMSILADLAKAQLKTQSKPPHFIQKIYDLALN